MSSIVDLDIPATAAEREQRLIECWDLWYETLPVDLRRKLSLHDFKRLGETFRMAFGIPRGELRSPSALGSFGPRAGALTETPEE